MKKLRMRIVQRLCDFGLWIYSLGPKNEEDKLVVRDLIARWKEAESQK